MVKRRVQYIFQSHGEHLGKWRDDFLFGWVFPNWNFSMKVLMFFLFVFCFSVCNS